MTQKFKGFYVTLERDIREDDAEDILTALRQIRGVIDVSPDVADSTDWAARTRVRAEIYQKLMKIVDEGLELL